MSKAEYIVFDIETYRTTRKDVVEQIAKEAREKRPAKSAAKAVHMAWDTEEESGKRVREALAKTSVDPMFAEIACVSIYCHGDVPITFMAAGDERDCLLQAREFLAEASDEQTAWVGHNIVGFDIPILVNRWRFHRVPPPPAFPHLVGGRAHGARVFDTMLRTPARTPFTSLDNACLAYGVELEAPVQFDGREMNGALVGEAVDRGEWDLLRAYCEQDVTVTADLYEAMVGPNRHGSWTRDDTLRAQLEEIEASNLDDAHKAILAVKTIKGAGKWPIK